MSLASTYAAAEGAAEAVCPTPWTGPGGILVASVDDTGNCTLCVQGVNYSVPVAVLLDFATWATNTFT